MSGQVFLSVSDVAQLLGVTVQTIYNWRLKGRLNIPTYKLGRMLKYKRADVEAWIAANNWAA